MLFFDVTEMFVYALKAALSKRHLVMRALVPFWIQGEKTAFRDSFYITCITSQNITLCNNNDQTCFSDTLTSNGTLGEVETLAFQAQVSTSPLGPGRC